jgi:hypothetical protein
MHDEQAEGTQGIHPYLTQSSSKFKPGHRCRRNTKPERTKQLLELQESCTIERARMRTCRKPALSLKGNVMRQPHPPT